MIEIKTKEDLTKLVENNETVLVDFFATWCGPCRMLSKTLDANEANLPCVIAKVNVDEARELAEEFDVQSVPTMFLFKKGIEVASKSGFVSGNGLLDWINNS